MKHDQPLLWLALLGYAAFGHADDWASFATISNTSPAYLCDITDDGRDLNCIAPNPVVDASGNVGINISGTSPSRTLTVSGTAWTRMLELDRVTGAAAPVSISILAGGGDNLGDHTAVQNLDMTGFAIAGAGWVSTTSISASTAEIDTFDGFTGFGGNTEPQAAVDATGGSVSTTNLILADGAVAGPGIYFNNDADTGLYRIGDNRLGIAAAGALSAEFTAAGISSTYISASYVQIPGAMHVLNCSAGLAGTMRYTSGTMQVCNGSEWGNIGIGVPTGTIAAFEASSCPDGWAEYTPARGRFLRGVDNGAGNDPDGTRVPGTAQVDLFKSHTHTYGQNLALGSGANLRAYSGGNTYSSGATGGAETRPKNVAVTFCQYSGYASLAASPGGVSGSIQFNDGTSLTGRSDFVMDASGNVGIGTSSPAAKLEVDGTVSATSVSMGSGLTSCSGGGGCSYGGGWAYLDCPADKKIVSGGCHCASPNSLYASRPQTLTRWGCVCGSSGAGQATASVSAICANLN